MKLRYKLIISLGIIMLMGSFWLNSYVWTRDMLKGYFIGNVMGIIAMVIGYWILGEKYLK